MSPALELGSLSLAPPGKPPSNISLSNSCVPSVLLLLVFDHLCCQFPGLIPEVNSGVNVPVTCWVSHTGQLAFPQSTNLVHKSWPSCGLRFVLTTWISYVISYPGHFWKSLGFLFITWVSVHWDLWSYCSQIMWPWFYFQSSGSLDIELPSFQDHSIP